MIRRINTDKLPIRKRRTPSGELDFGMSEAIAKAINEAPTPNQAAVPAFNQIASLRPGGYLKSENLMGLEPTLEMDTFTCVHCQSIVIMHPHRQRPRNTCRKCMRTTCDQAACVFECDPWEKKFEAGRPFLQPHQVPADKAEQWFPKSVRDKTPPIWLPRSVGGRYGAPR
mgnify:CR=1 FL=1